MSIQEIEMFKELTNIERAKLLGSLEKEMLPTGAILFEQGDTGRSMYIIERGKIEVFTKGTAGDLRSLATLTDGDAFGEMAMLTGEARSATAIATKETTLYVIDYEVFQRLLAENTKISSYFIHLLSQRLISTNASLRDSKEKAAHKMEQDLLGMPAYIARLVYRCAVLPSVTPDLLEYFTNQELEEILKVYPHLIDYVSISEQEELGLCIKPELRVALKESFINRYGYEELQQDVEIAADFYLAKGLLGHAVDLYIEYGKWENVLDIIAEATLEIDDMFYSDESKTDIERQLAKILPLVKYCPKEVLASRFEVLDHYLLYCRQHDREAGLLIVEQILELETALLTPQQHLSLYEWGARFAQELNKAQLALKYIQLAEMMTVNNDKLDLKRIDQRHQYEMAKQSLTQKKTEQLAHRASRLFKRNRLIELAAVLLAIVSVVAFALMEPIVGLSSKAMLFIGFAIAAVILWIIDIFPDYVVALGMLMAWVVSGIVSVEVALSGFGSTTWLFMIFIMAMSAAIIKSGILYRFSLHALKWFPPSYRGQMWGIAAGGIIMNPLIPSSNAKVTLGVPMAQTLAESLGFANKSAGAASFGLAAMIFYGFIAPFVLTGSYTNIMAYGLASTEQSISWMQWFIYALPGFIIFSIFMVIVLLMLFRNPVATLKNTVTREVLDEQLRLLGPLSKLEIYSLLTVVVCIGLMIIQPLHGLDSTWIMFIGFAFLVISGILDRQTIASGIDWTFLLFLGVAFSFASITEELAISTAMSSFLAEHMAWAVASPLLFLLSVIIISFAVTLIIRDDPAVILLVTALIPLGSAMGIHPWIMVFVILLATDPFFFKYQSPTYLNAFYSSAGKLFTHQQGQKLAFAYALAVVLLVTLSLPYWKWLGLIP